MTILILFILVVGAIILLFNSIIPPIMTNLRLLLESLPMFGDSIDDYIKELGPYVESFINQQQIDQITNFITNLLSTAGTYVLQLGTGVITNATGFAISTLTTIQVIIKNLEKVKNNIK